MNGAQALHEVRSGEIGLVEQKIGKYIAEELVEDGSTLQLGKHSKIAECIDLLGIGAIPGAVLSQLSHHRDLGVHTEMFSDGLVDLVNLGVITNSKKVVRTGKTVTSLVTGTKKAFDFLDNNPSVGR